MSHLWEDKSSRAGRRERKIDSKQTRGKEQVPQLLSGGGSKGVREEPVATGLTHHHAKLLRLCQIIIFVLQFGKHFQLLWLWHLLNKVLKGEKGRSQCEGDEMTT